MNDRSDAKPIPVAEFEGQYIRAFEGKLPAITLDMPEGYARGTHLKMEVEVRIRSVRLEEIQRGADKGDLTRQHVFALEEVRLLGAYSPDEVDPGVGGSASVAAIGAEPEEDEEELVFLCGAGTGGGEVCMMPRGHEGAHDPDYEDLPRTGTGDVGF